MVDNKEHREALELVKDILALVELRHKVHAELDNLETRGATITPSDREAALTNVSTVETGKRETLSHYLRVLYRQKRTYIGDLAAIGCQLCMKPDGG